MHTHLCKIYGEKADLKHFEGILFTDKQKKVHFEGLELKWVRERELLMHDVCDPRGIVLCRNLLVYELSKRKWLVVGN